MAKTAELDTKKEAPPDINGHGESDEEFLQHITSKEPAEELLDVPEWDKQVLCKALYAEARIKIQDLAYNPEIERMNYAPYVHLVALYGSYNPTSGNRVFSDAHKEMLQDPRHAGAVVRLASVILRLSRMVVAGNDVEQAKKK
jgi:hypothetical protein